MANKRNNIDFTILLLDDYIETDESIGNFLRKRGCKVIFETNPKRALQIFQEEEIDIIITDIKMPELNGIEFIKQIKKLNEDIEFIIITAYREMDTMKEAISLGVTEYLDKPVGFNELLLAIEKTRKYISVLNEKKQLETKLKNLSIGENYSLNSIIGNSKQIIEIKNLIKKLAEYPETSVLIEGESGTGKELIARAIHFEGPNANKPFVPVNSSSIPETLIESELFGHEKGSFTDAKERKKGLFEQANGGTIFLDEIGDISLAVQKNLLRVLENREIRYVGGNTIKKINVRVIAATNKNLEKMVLEGTFRQDLFYRLNIFRIYIPPLRERKEDIELLVTYFIKFFNKRLNKNIKGITPAALEKLKDYNFPGNIRELRNMIEQASILCDDNYLMNKHFPLLQMLATKYNDLNLYDDLNLEKMEKKFIIKALEKANYNKAKACKLLGITRDSLRRKLDKYSITVSKHVKGGCKQL